MITGVFSKYQQTTDIAKEVIGIREGLNHIGAMHIVNGLKGMLFLKPTSLLLTDTLTQRH